jgi:hypothetical protein
VVTEIVQTTPAKDVVNALCFTAERDLPSMRTLAQAFLPYLKQKEEELRPKVVVKGGGSRCV